MISSAKKIVGKNQELPPNPFIKMKVPNHVLLEIRKLYGPRPWPFIGQLTWAWVVMISTIYIANSVGTWWSTFLGILIIASRQNILGLLVHDQAHKLGFRGRKGDIITNLFAGYPLLVLSVENYAKVHLTHHKYYFSDHDPDHLRKSGPEWTVPMSKIKLLGWLMRDACGLSILKVIQGKNVNLTSTEFKRARPTPKFVRPLFYIGVVLFVTYFKLWPIFLLYWLLPLLTVLPMIVRWGALTEHIYNTAGYQIEENSPLIIPGWMDRILLPNLNFSFHPYHHWYPAVSFSHLPEIHEIYINNGLIDKTRIFYGYSSFFKFITQSKSHHDLNE